MSFVAIRVVILFSDRIFGSEWGSVLLAPADRIVAEDTHNAINARMAAVTWSPLTFVVVTAKLAGCNGIELWPFLALVVLVVVTSIGLLKLPLRYFQGDLTYVFVLAAASAFDVVFTFVSDNFWRTNLCAHLPVLSR